MSIEKLREQIEPFLDDKGYTNSKTRDNYCSYVKCMLDFMQDKNYQELNEAVIAEYLKKYEGTKLLATRQAKVEEFFDFVKGDIAVNETEQIEVKEADTDMATPTEQIQRGRPKKSDVENNKRKQVSVYLNVETYGNLQDISYFTGLDISKLCENAILKLIENNQVQLQKAQELKSKISEMNFEV